MRLRIWIGAVLAFVLVVVVGAGSIHIYSFQDEPAFDSSGQRLPSVKELSRMREFPQSESLQDGVFIGIAVSGGGSRAANFGAAVLQELKALGMLEHATMISCVSGGCLPAAYYALHASNTDWSRLKELLRENLYSRWVMKLLYPHNLLRSIFTDWDRSDAMASVFNDVLFDHKTFSDLPPDGPRLLINATALGGYDFAFSQDGFETLGARLDNYPIASAVMASGAFPAAFNNVTLANYNPDWPQLKDDRRSSRVASYFHLFDGGPVDNLGVTKMLGYLDNMVFTDRRANRMPLKGCLLILVDAYPDLVPRWRMREGNRSDPRGGIDFLVDRNVVDATDAMLSRIRGNLIETLRNDSGYSLGHSAAWVYHMNVKLDDTQTDLECMIWHLAFERLDSVFIPQGPLKESVAQASALAAGAETNYKLTGRNCSGANLQSALYQSAEYLVRQDKESLAQVCSWFSDAGIAPKGCNAAPPEFVSRKFDTRTDDQVVSCR